MNGLKFVSESMDPPIGQEFGKISSELALGVDIPTALERFRERVASKNVFLFVIAVKVANPAKYSSCGCSTYPGERVPRTKCWSAH